MTDQITVFDGAKTIGGTKIYLRSGETGVFLDFGMSFKKYGRYFEEFLTPRTARGVHDFLTLGLIPHIQNIYREDIFPEDVTIESGIELKVDGVFLSHAHMDHIGNIGFLDPSIPIYSSAMTAVIAKAMQDCGRSDIGGEVSYYAPRVLNEKNPKALKAARNVECVGRKYNLVDKQVDHLRINEYWNQSFGKKKIGAKPVGKGQYKVGNIEFEAIPVDHSIFGATAFLFNLGDKSLVYTGDFRMHGMRDNLTSHFIKRLIQVKPDYLIVEGTNMSSDKSSVKGERSSEQDVMENCLEAVKNAKGKLVIADFGPRNIERLNIFLKIAHQTDRKLVITSKDAFLLNAMRVVDEQIPDIGTDSALYIYDEIKSSSQLWERDFIRAKFDGKYINAEEIRKNQDSFILAFSYFDLKNILDILPDGGIYIYSTCEAFTEEMMIDVWRLANWLERFDLEPVGFKFRKAGKKPEDCQISFEKGYHASGHVSSDELIDLIHEVKPKAIIPVHTEYPQEFLNRLGADFKVLLADEETPIDL